MNCNASMLDSEKHEKGEVKRIHVSHQLENLVICIWNYKLVSFQRYRYRICIGEFVTLWDLYLDFGIGALDLD